MSLARKFLLLGAAEESEPDDDERVEELGEEDSEDDGEEDQGDIEGLLTTEHVTESKEEHEALDAILRCKEDERLQAIARRFEDMAEGYMKNDDDELHSQRRQLAVAARKRKAERDAQEREAMAAREAAEKAAEAEAAAKQAAKQAALFALYEHGPARESAPSAGSCTGNPAKMPPLVSGEKAHEQASKTAPPVARYRIKKKARVA